MNSASADGCVDRGALVGDDQPAPVLIGVGHCVEGVPGQAGSLDDGAVDNDGGAAALYGPGDLGPAPLRDLGLEVWRESLHDRVPADDDLPNRKDAGRVGVVDVAEGLGVVVAE